jgi:purine-binding chemotaxis protein CheW
MAAFVFFTAAGQTFALPAANVVQVLRMAAPTPVPGAPSFVRGLLNVRGLLLPVIDVRVRLGSTPRPVRAEDQLLVAESGGRRVALEVERVVDVRDLPDGASEPHAGWAAPAALVSGAVKVQDGVVVVQAVDAWLAEAEAAAGRSS